MANYKELVPFIQKWEGGWADDPDDLGGATMKGVTLTTYTDYLRRKGDPAPTKADLRRITESEWEEVFKTMYWDRWKADSINSQSVANILVDWVWASGVYGIKIPQRVLGVTVDGLVGPKTLAAVNDEDPKAFFNEIWQERVAYVYRIVENRPTNKKYIKGWLNRINDIRFTS